MYTHINHLNANNEHKFHIMSNIILFNASKMNKNLIL